MEVIRHHFNLRYTDSTISPLGMPTRYEKNPIKGSNVVAALTNSAILR